MASTRELHLALALSEIDHSGRKLSGGPWTSQALTALDFGVYKQMTIGTTAVVVEDSSDVWRNTIDGVLLVNDGSVDVAVAYNGGSASQTTLPANGLVWLPGVTTASVTLLTASGTTQVRVWMIGT